MGCIYSYYNKVKTPFFNEDTAKAVSKRIDKEILMELKNEPDEIEILIMTRQGELINFIDLHDVKCQLEFKRMT